ncbi:MAG TPA: hypothetical protein VKZ45_04135, partial [Vicingaceae bacterium]|nr:hypothetical protein [Vicingaceae bacterium]
FSNELKNLSKIPKEYQIEVMTEPDIAFEDVNYWKSKYFELLSQYKQLLESKLEDYFKKE